MPPSLRRLGEVTVQGAWAELAALQIVSPKEFLQVLRNPVSGDEMD
jgi:hypothetical protein